MLAAVYAVPRSGDVVYCPSESFGVIESHMTDVRCVWNARCADCQQWRQTYTTLFGWSPMVARLLDRVRHTLVPCHACREEHQAHERRCHLRPNRYGETWGLVT